MDTVFGYVAALISNREDVATKALQYILNGSPAGRCVMQKIVRTCSSAMPQITAYDAWPGSKHGEGHPDMRGISCDQREMLIIECKFWARLTEHQPITYLRRLDSGGVLLFIVPEERRRWGAIELELDRKLEIEKGVAMGRWNGDPLNAGTRWRSIENSKFLAIVSWQSLLDEIKKAVAVDYQTSSTLADVDQLIGFCECAGLTGDRFVPFKDTLSSTEIPTIIESLRSVVNKVNDRAVLELGFTSNMIKETSNEYGYDLWSNEIAFWFGLYHIAWLRFGKSPLWIHANYIVSRDPQRVREALSAIARKQNVSTALDIPDESGLYVPMLVAPNAAESDVVEGILRTLRELKLEFDKVPL
jgi:hypothetical protein